MKHFIILMTDGTELKTIKPIDKYTIESGSGVAQFFSKETKSGRRLTLGVVPIANIKCVLLVDSL